MVENLEKVRDKIIKECKEKFKVYQYAEYSLKKKDCIDWYDENYSEFLILAEQLGVKLIYFAEMNILDEETDETKLGQIEIGFFFEGVFHVFSLEADWFIEENSVEEESPNDLKEKTIQEISEKSSEYWSKEIISFVEKDYKQAIDDKVLFLQEAITDFWKQKNIPDTWSLDRNLRIKLESVTKRVEMYFQNIKLKEEKEILDSLIDECVKWCKEEGLNKLVKANLNLFLAQKELNLSSVGESVLFGKVNNILKNKN